MAETSDTSLNSHPAVPDNSAAPPFSEVEVAPVEAASSPGFRVMAPDAPRMARGASPDALAEEESLPGAETPATGERPDALAEEVLLPGAEVPATAEHLEPTPYAPEPVDEDLVQWLDNPADELETEPAQSEWLRRYTASGADPSSLELLTADVPGPENPVSAPSDTGATAAQEQIVVAPVGPPLPPLPPLGGGTGSGSGGEEVPPGAPVTTRDIELGLFEHLAELRQRILYCVYFVCAMSVVTWNYGTSIQNYFAAPIIRVLQNSSAHNPGDKLISTHPASFFTLYCQISLIAAIILSMPFLIFQVWRFLEPALTKRERRYTSILVPFSITLFGMGVGLGYWISPMFYRYFIAFRPANVSASWDYYDTLILQFKLLLAFGIAFQVPVITIFLNKAGIVSRNWLIEYWRHAIIVIFTVVAFITPTWDPLTLTICATPPCLLYLLSIWLIKWL